MSLRGGGQAVRAKGSNDPFTMWEMNFSHFSPLVLNEACLRTQQYYTEVIPVETRQEKDMQILDYISKFFLAYREAAIQDRKQAMAGFTDLYTYLDTPRAREIYAYYTAAFIQACFVYIYTTNCMGLGISRGLGLEAVELLHTNNILGSLKDDTRRTVMAELKEAGYIPADSSYEHLKRSTLPFSKIICDEQERQLKGK
jgi:hypothetical protein